jgi:hypothetical protein
LFVKWKDSHGQWQSDWENLLYDTLYAVGNGWDEYAVVGPIDLDSVPDLNWASGNASELWVRITVGPSPYEPQPPIDVRIGWIKLEETSP